MITKWSSSAYRVLSVKEALVCSDCKDNYPDAKELTIDGLDQFEEFCCYHCRETCLVEQ